MFNRAYCGFTLGHSMAVSRQDSQPAPAQAPRSRRNGSGRTLADALVDRLRSDLLAVRFEPGEKLRIDALCQRYDAKATPLREALNRLCATGLVESRAQRGFYCAPLKASALDELITTRIWLESLALRESIAHATVEYDETLVLALHRLSRAPRSLSQERYVSNPDWEALHEAFHQSLLAACGSGWLLGFCAQLAEQAFRYRQLAMRNAFKVRPVLDEHQAIVGAVLDRNADLACQLLAQHFDRTRVSIGHGLASNN